MEMAMQANVQNILEFVYSFRAKEASYYRASKLQLIQFLSGPRPRADWSQNESLTQVRQQTRILTAVLNLQSINKTH